MKLNLFCLLLISTISFICCNCLNKSTSHVPFKAFKEIKIIQDNGNVRNSERYIKYCISRNELPKESIKRIEAILTTTENLFCSNDGATYQVGVKNDKGHISTYVSDNKKCGRNDEDNFISVSDIKNILIAVPSTNYEQ